MAATVGAVITGVVPSSDGGTDATSVSATWTTPNIPTTGDLLIASFTTQGGQTVTPPTGWTELTTVDQPNPLSYITFWVGYRYRQSGDSNTVTFSIGTALPMSLMVRDIKGMVASGPLDIANMIGAFEGATYSVTSDSGTASAINELVLLDMFANIGSHTATWSVPTGFTQDTEIGSVDGSQIGTSLAGCHSTNATTAIAAQTVTLTQAGYGNADVIVTQYVIKPLTGTTHGVTATDTGATVSDALSLAQLPYPPTGPDQAAAFSDAVVLSVKQAGAGFSGVQHIHLFRRGNWLHHEDEETNASAS